MQYKSFLNETNEVGSQCDKCNAWYHQKSKNFFNLVVCTDSYGKKILRAALAKVKPPEFEAKERNFDPSYYDEDDPFSVNGDNASDISVSWFFSPLLPLEKHCGSLLAW